MTRTQHTKIHLDERLTQAEVARRWKISPRSLEKWRTVGIGPAFVKIGSRVRYREEDILTFEAEQLRGGR
jgi:predicted site-specific integrase-resolvase